MTDRAWEQKSRCDPAAAVRELNRRPLPSQTRVHSLEEQAIGRSAVVRRKTIKGRAGMCAAKGKTPLLLGILAARGIQPTPSECA